MVRKGPQFHGADILIEYIPNDKNMNKINTDNEKYNKENKAGRGHGEAA